MTSKRQPRGREKAGPVPRAAQPNARREPSQPAAPTHTSALVRSAAGAGAPLTPRDVMQLQRAVGNRAVGRLLSGAAPRPDAPPEADASSGRDAPRAEAPSQPSGPVVQRALSHADQQAVGFSSRRDAGNSNRVTAAMMRTDGTLAGSAPAADPPGYNYIRQLQLTNFWIRFHLVNEEAGGPGTANNLVPASKRDNSQYEVNVERRLKETVNDLNREMDEDEDDDLDDGAMSDEEEEQDLVFFGAEVTYGTAAAGTQRQRENAPFFPTRVTYYHELYDAADDDWTWEANGRTFDLQDAQPTDHGGVIRLSAISRDQLRHIYNGYRWDDNDVAFIRSLAGGRRADFEGRIDASAALGPAESAATALDNMPFGQFTTFGERVSNEDAIDALGAAIGNGTIVIA